MAKYITPAVTPLRADGAVDTAGAARLYDHLIAGGVDGILVLGSIGEFFALPMEQKKALVAQAVKTIAHRVPLIVGAADTVFEQVVGLSRYAIAQGADAVIVVPPYYFTLGGQSIEDYYDHLAEAIPGNIYLYNFPDRTGYQIPAEAVKRLALRHPNIVGCKDTVAGMDHTRELIKAVKPVRPDFEIYSGFDDNFAHNVLSGGDGCIAGLSNLAPEVTSAWVRAIEKGDLREVAAIQRRVDRLMDVYSVGTPFVPYIKRAMQLRGLGVGAVSTFPLPAPTPEDDRRLTEILKDGGLL